AAEERDRQRMAKEASMRDAIGEAVRKGDAEALAALVPETARVIYQTRDPYFGADIVEMEGQGPEQAKLVLARALEQLGRPQSVSCEKDDQPYSPHICRWTMRNRTNGMFAFVHFNRDKLTGLQVYYMTREKALQFQRQAA